MKSIDEINIVVIGMGYVGLPLAIEFGKIYQTVGVDLDNDRIRQLKQSIDSTGEVDKNDFAKAKKLSFSNALISNSTFTVYIIAVPTPIDEFNEPNLTALSNVSVQVGRVLKPGEIVVFESTVYPGVTEEFCAPILEQHSNLKYAYRQMPEDNNVFYLGYSPERINPGDKNHRLTDIVKVTSGSTPEIADFVDKLYGSIISAGTFKAASIKIAEAAKVIENTQRDVNIALINELAMLFDRLELDTEAVLEAAATKWNFLPFRPGLVGGHCIGVDPYYLTHKAQKVGHDPEMILAGRRINDNMASYVADRIIRLMLNNSINVVGARILVLGLTFKENCPDTRNSKVVDMVNALVDVQAQVDVHDPYVEIIKVPDDLKAGLISQPEIGVYDCIVVAVSHSVFIKMGAGQIRNFGKENHVLFDLKYAFNASETDERL